jgi:hypothetical protein
MHRKELILVRGCAACLHIQSNYDQRGRHCVESRGAGATKRRQGCAVFSAFWLSLSSRCVGPVPAAATVDGCGRWPLAAGCVSWALSKRRGRERTCFGEISADRFFFAVVVRGVVCGALGSNQGRGDGAARPKSHERRVNQVKIWIYSKVLLVQLADLLDKIKYRRIWIWIGAGS